MTERLVLTEIETLPTAETHLAVGDSVHDSIERLCRQDPSALCFSLWQQGRWQPYSRAEFWQHVQRWSKVFSRSYEDQSLILFIKKLDVHLLAAYIGAMHAGHLPAQLSPLNSKTTHAEYSRKIRHILELTHAKALFVDSADNQAWLESNDLEVFTPETAPADVASQSPSSNPLALVQFSSGSTGLQKGVALRHSSLVAHMRSYSRAIGLSPQDRIISWLPLYHDMGLIACYLMPLMCGVPFFQIDTFDWLVRPDLLLQGIEEQQATVCFLPNFAYPLLANKGKARDLRSMRLFVNCSEPAREAAHRQFLTKFPTLNPSALTVSYALAENTFAVSQTLPGGLKAARTGTGMPVLSCGPVIANTEVRIFDANDQGEGEIGIRGNFLFESFTDGTRPLRDGFYLTGDLGFLSEGELYVTGRKKDIIIVNGKNIYPQDVEYVASGVPGVYPGRVACFGVTNDGFGTEDLFVIAETDGSRPPAEIRADVQRAVADEVAIVPKRVEVIDHMSLSKTSSGKISRSRNRELYLNKELTLL